MLLTITIIFGLAFLVAVGIGGFLVLENTIGTPHAVRKARMATDIERHKAEQDIIKWKRDQILNSRLNSERELPAAAVDLSNQLDGSEKKKPRTVKGDVLAAWIKDD